MAVKGIFSKKIEQGELDRGAGGMVRRAAAYFMNRIGPDDRNVFVKSYRASGGKLESTYSNPEQYISAADRNNKFSTLRQNVHIGGLYIYRYEAKYKDKLPYWDVFPLLFLIKVTPDHFMGLNLHYIAPRQRALLMDAIRNHLVRNNLDPADMDVDKGKQTTRARTISYQQLKGASKHLLFKPCVKKYLQSPANVRSQFVKVPYDQWNEILFLPLQRFHKKSSKHVWLQSNLRG
jgi:hypothetical protein